MKDIFVIIPSLDPDEKLCKTVQSLKDIGFEKIIVVDDGSKKEFCKNFPQKEDGVILLRHKVNRGKGAAMKSAFEYILKKYPKAKSVVTVDADGQHLAKDALACALAVTDNNMVLGCRDFSGPDVPPRSRFGNHTTSRVFKLLCGIKISDTQTGLRAFPVSLLPFLLTIEGDRYEYETNMLIKFKQAGYGFTEVKIETVYIEQNQTSHFRVIRDSVRVYSFILKYALSSLISSVADILAFFFLNLFFGPVWGAFSETICTFLARAVSSFINLNINRKRVFASGGSYGKTVLKYYAVAIPQMIASAIIVTGFTMLFGAEAVGSTVIKAIVDTVLFFISYRLQQTFVFADKKVKKEKKKSKFLKIFGRVWLCIGTTLLALIIAAYSACFVIAHGPSPALRNMLVISAMQASATKWVPYTVLKPAKVDEIMAGSAQVNTEIVTTGDIQPEPNEGEWDNCPDEGIQLHYIQKSKFKAYMLIVKDPSRIKVGISDENFKDAKEGKRILQIAEKYKCLAAMNGGGFSDPGGVGTGAQPMGLTYSGGKCVWEATGKHTFIGITKNNELISAEQMTKAKADELGIRDGVSFLPGNTLIQKEGDSVKLLYGDKNTGTSQRSAIAQRADGAMILLVTDGRSAASVGATRNDIIDILVEYGAVSAGMLDGGSSSMLYYENYIEKYNIDESTLDNYQFKGLVNRYKAFTAPRRMPTYFIVSR